MILESPTGFGVRRRSKAQSPLSEAPCSFELFARCQSQSGDFADSVTAVQDAIALPCTGRVEVADKVVRFIRPGLVEEYSVSMDGVRQDFVVLEKPTLNSQLSTLKQSALRVQLAVTGAKVKLSAYGAELVLEKSGRKIAYSRFRVTDATGRELTARMEVASGNLPAATVLALVVEDAQAVYPIRVDPTFSDANWTSMNPSIPGSDRQVYAAVVDGSGNLYIGGGFTVLGDVVASYIAKWNGSSWSTLGSGMNSLVLALAMSGSDLYAAGYFTTAGSVSANGIAKWNGSNWSALRSGMLGEVRALVVSGTDLYAGGHFVMAGGVSANSIAKWNGSSWSALGSGMGDGGSNPPYVYALAVSGSALYAGGDFTTAGGVPANRIARWNGSAWSALGLGVSDTVEALAVSGSDVYAGGYFKTAGGVVANRIAKWNGSSWSALGSGLNDIVYALALSGSNLYAGGLFYMVDGQPANFIAKWDGSSWSALGSWMNGIVYALALSGNDLYAAGYRVAKWNGSSWSTLGSGLGIRGYALALSGNDLFAGGDFTKLSGVSATNIAKWNGSSWSALGSGMGGGQYPYVYALAAEGIDLYAGGEFTTAGGKVSAYLARAVLGDAPGYNQITGTLLSGGAMQFSYIGDPATNYALDRALNLTPPISWAGQRTNTMSVSGVLLFTNTPAPGTNNFWRMRSVP